MTIPQTPDTPQSPTIDLLAINAVAPGYYDLPADKGEWARKAKAFIQSMTTLDRVVLIEYDDERDVLYLSSVAQEVSGG